MGYCGNLYDMYNREFPRRELPVFHFLQDEPVPPAMRLSVSRRKNSKAPARRICPGWEPLFPGIFRTVEKFSKKLQIVQEIFLVVRFIRWYHNIDLRS